MLNGIVARAKPAPVPNRQEESKISKSQRKEYRTASRQDGILCETYR